MSTDRHPASSIQHTERSVAFVTLGCKVNQYETQVMREALKRQGYRMAASGDAADIYVINTCTVTGVSDRKARQMIRRATSSNPDAVVVVTGCYVERSPDEIRDMPGVDLALTNSEKSSIGEYLREFEGEISSSPTLKRKDREDFEDCFLHPPITTFDGQTRALVKIQDGCDSFCTYCIVPHVRGGAIRSRPVDSIIREVRALAENGYREVVLTGIHLGAYGKELDGGTSLTDVIVAIHDVDGIERIRLSSIEPMDVSDDLIREMARLPKCAQHFHISLQSGSDKILKLMRRGYTSAEFENLVTRIRSAIPDVGLSTDVMVGFPGETEQDFSDTCDFISRVKFSRLHVFRYSPRSGTPAAKFPDQVQNIVATRRSEEVRALGDHLAREFRSRMLEQTVEVLLEDSREGKDRLLAGFTSNYVRVLAADATDELVGQVIQVKLMDMQDEYMIGLVNS